LWESSGFVAPLIVWAILSETPLGKGKSLANLVEVLLVILAVFLAIIVRIVIGKRTNEAAVAAALIISTCFVAAIVFIVTPPLPE
jgi:uncharacterized membrane protein